MGDLDVTWARRIEDLEQLVKEQNMALEVLKEENQHMRNELAELNNRFEKEP